jgi:hypothetical protein
MAGCALKGYIQSPPDPHPLEPFPNPFPRVLVVAFSPAAVFNLACNVPPAAACATTTVSMVTHAVTALAHGAVLAVYWCRRIRR